VAKTATAFSTHAVAAQYFSVSILGQSSQRHPVDLGRKVTK